VFCISAEIAAKNTFVGRIMQAADILRENPALLRLILGYNIESYNFLSCHIYDLTAVFMNSLCIFFTGDVSS
jgi:hypothetical protein